MRWWGRVLAAVVVLTAGMGSAQAPGAKLALVIGVSEYGRERAAQEAAGFIVPPALANAVRDSELIASALESKGFAVTRVTNPDKRALLSAMNTFAGALNRSGPDAVAVFYFAGHGAQGRPALERDIDNYLIPLGADLATEVDLESEALALSRVSAALKPGPQGAVVLILDACRDFALPAASRSGLVTRGLAEARAAPGTYIAYATAPGFTALDAVAGQLNGPYASALATEIRAAQGAPIESVFIAVRNRVLAQTSNTQVPWENSSLRRSVVLGVAQGARPCAAQTGLTAPPDWMCRTPELTQLSMELYTTLAGKLQSVSPYTATVMTSNQQRWLDFAFTSCHLSDGPQAPQQTACVMSLTGDRTLQTQKSVEAIGGYTFVAVERYERTGSSARQIRFPRIEGETPQIQRFNSLAVQMPEFALADGASEQIDYEITYASPKVVSMRLDRTQREAGARFSSSDQSAISIAMTTGDAIGPTQLFLPNAGWANFLATRITTSWRSRGAELPSNAENVALSIGSKSNRWLFRAQGLEILLNHDDLPPITRGGGSVIVPWTALRSYLRPDAPVP